MANQIYFVTLRFDTDVHVQGVGFTRIHHDYARGRSAGEATRRASQHYERKYKLIAERASARLAKKQDKLRYTFPEKII